MSSDHVGGRGGSLVHTNFLGFPGPAFTHELFPRGGGVFRELARVFVAGGLAFDHELARVFVVGVGGRRRGGGWYEGRVGVMRVNRDSTCAKAFWYMRDRVWKFSLDPPLLGWRRRASRLYRAFRLAIETTSAGPYPKYVRQVDGM